MQLSCRATTTSRGNAPFPWRPRIRRRSCTWGGGATAGVRSPGGGTCHRESCAGSEGPWVNGGAAQEALMRQEQACSEMDAVVERQRATFGGEEAAASDGRRRRCRRPWQRRQPWRNARRRASRMRRRRGSDCLFAAAHEAALEELEAARGARRRATHGRWRQTRPTWLSWAGRLSSQRKAEALEERES